MITIVGHKNVALPIHCDSAWAVELSGGALSLSMAHRCASARQRGHQALRRDPANAIVVKVGHYNIAVSVRRHSPGAGEFRGVAFSVLIAPFAGARQCRHYCGSRHIVYYCCDRRRYPLNMMRTGD
eukprot:9185138-Pyramimonas_sp.AAC.1